MSFQGEAWIDDHHSENVVFVKAKDCDFNPANFIRELTKYVGEEYIPLSQTQEGYFRYIPSYSHDYDDYGYWVGCKPGKGASLHYYAEVKFVDPEGGPADA